MVLCKVMLAPLNSPNRKLATELPQLDNCDDVASGWLVIWLLKLNVPAVFDWLLLLLA